MTNYQLNQYAYVNGVEGAEGYQMMPNQTMLLMDSKEACFYLKTTDQMGRCNQVKKYKFEEVPLRSEENQYASVADIHRLMAELENIKSMLGAKPNEQSSV